MAIQPPQPGGAACGAGARAGHRAVVCSLGLERSSRHGACSKSDAGPVPTCWNSCKWGSHRRNLVGIELLADRFAQAMQRLPSGVTLMQGDASLVKLPDESEDIVLQSTVFSSLLDAPFQWRLAQAMWRWVRPAAACCGTTSRSTTRATPTCAACRWPASASCFRRARCNHRRVTLAPPVARAVCRVHPCSTLC